MTNLAAWVRQQLDADERALRAVEGLHRAWYFDYIDDAAEAFVDLALNEDRVRRQIAAHRAILDLYVIDRDGDGKPFVYGGYGEAYAEAVVALAGIYADRPGYAEAIAEWPAQPEVTP